MERTYNTIRCDVADGILTITLNRPEKLNALTVEMCYDCIDALERADLDDRIRAIIFTGAGRAYCAGSDLDWRDTTKDRTTNEEYRDGGGILTLRMFDCKKPIIGAINGSAAGIGMTMTLPMDVRIFAKEGKYGFVFVRRALSPEACSTWFLPRIVGMTKATEWMLTGRILNADELYHANLASYALPAEEVYAKAVEIAKEIVTYTAPVSVALTRQMLWKSWLYDHPMDAHKLDSKTLHYLTHAADAAEGINSFLEKRPPEFGMSPVTDLPAYYPWWQPRTFPPTIRIKD